MPPEQRGTVAFPIGDEMGPPEVAPPPKTSGHAHNQAGDAAARRMLSSSDAGASTNVAKSLPGAIMIDGVKIVAGPGVGDDAVAKCAEIVQAEIGRNAYAQEQLKRISTTMIIVPANTQMTDMPQFKDLQGKQTFDGRTWDTVRGSGGMVLPDGTYGLAVAEENLDGAKSIFRGYDPRYSVAMHEFAHTLNQQGMTPEQKARVEELYRKHIAADPGDKKDTFTEQYGASNYLEYFAQSTNCYFGRNVGIGHNGKEWLQKNDPDMYTFLVEMYEHGYDQSGIDLSSLSSSQGTAGSR